MTNKLYTSGTVVDSGSLNDFNTSAYNFLSAIAGTADNITAVGPLSMLSYVAGQKFLFIPTGTNTTNATINISGLGSRAITKYGNTLLIAGDLVTGKVAEIVYDGVGFQLINPQTFNLTNVVPVTSGGTGATTAAQALINLGATGRLINIRAFTANATYTPTAGTTSIVAHVVGGGGGGGNANGTAAGQVSVGGGGGAGGYAIARITSGFSGAAITIGAGGVAATAGTASSLGALVVANGGAAGSAGAAGAVSSAAGGNGGTTTGGNVLAQAGANGSLAVSSFAAGYVFSGEGAGTCFGSGASHQIASSAGGGVGVNAVPFGAGGSGAANGASQAAAGGGTGKSGIIIIYEYS